MSKSDLALTLNELFTYCENDEALLLSQKINYLEDINQQDPVFGRTQLSVSAFFHSYRCVDLLINNGANINSVNFKGTSVLMYAKTKVIENRNFKFLDYLIEKGADPHLKDIYGKNIFDYVNETTDNELIEYFRRVIKNV